MPGEPLQALRRAREDTAAQIAALHRDLDGVIDASRSSNADDEHDPEGATIAFERAQVAALLDAARRRLAELDDALARVAAGTFGRCEVCGRRIPAERLEIRPAARTCVGCATH
ncbi:TraR/DksA C4-type zinc finger protein [Dactylosporangium aurantiacum]|uniref:TraR/DksA C4-type zinc finger protein n=1 Tax=Dactylosporangium aurantiacum TaxID=35754 RepID=A0A9Q9IK92_9ACTN|nr:TraR/DksA C4-type zinc finger protein [Dactylosporangium aurantiacum]MDG6103202.1 TraR/DksA C4-type zinc finger protein [Dactylosporangium aurantiacum]UWZ57707.1 TraR/DksA C4-type zinc finger protein [Dactylosporangium aurantiacum]